MAFKMKYKNGAFPFKTHNMYKTERAETEAEHNALKEKGFDHNPYKKKNKDGKEQGVDGRACWKGYKYAGTEDGSDKCVEM